MLRWPWVSRSALHAERDGRYAAVNRANSAEFLLGRERERYESLLEKYHALKLQGATAPDAPIPTEPTAPREPSIIAQVIREQSGGDPRLAAHLRTYAGQLKRAGNKDEEIAFALGQWVSTEPETLS